MSSAARVGLLIIPTLQDFLTFTNRVTDLIFYSLSQMGKLIIFILSWLHHCIVCVCVCVFVHLCVEVGKGGDSDQRNLHPDSKREDVYH